MTLRFKWNECLSGDGQNSSSTLSSKAFSAQTPKECKALAHRKKILDFQWQTHNGNWWKHKKIPVGIFFNLLSIRRQKVKWLPRLCKTFTFNSNLIMRAKSAWKMSKRLTLIKLLDWIPITPTRIARRGNANRWLQFEGRQRERPSAEEKLASSKLVIANEQTSKVMRSAHCGNLHQHQNDKIHSLFAYLTQTNSVLGKYFHFHLRL